MDFLQIELLSNYIKLVTKTRVHFNKLLWVFLGKKDTVSVTLYKETSDHEFEDLMKIQAKQCKRHLIFEYTQQKHMKEINQKVSF